MKHFGLAAVSVLAMAASVAAAPMQMPESVTMSTKQFSGYTPKKGPVTFNHASHMSVSCVACHHTVPDTYTFQGCMSEGCHDNIASRTDENSVYRAFHTGQDKRSCVACHREVKKQGLGDAPLACNSCHIKE
jgi:opacity protein-like surface antigen